MTDIIIQGIYGRMGRALVEKIAARTDCRVVAGVDREAGRVGEIPVYASWQDVACRGIVIDFSSPAGAAAGVPPARLPPKGTEAGSPRGSPCRKRCRSSGSPQGSGSALRTPPRGYPKFVSSCAASQAIMPAGPYRLGKDGAFALRQTQKALHSLFQLLFALFQFNDVL